jgi:hypothetical protein
MAALPVIETLSVKDARAQIIERMKAANLPTLPVASVADRTIPGPAGDLPVRIYTPNGTSPFPLLVFSSTAALRYLQPRYARLCCSQLVQHGGLRRGFGRLPPCTGKQVSCRPRRLLRRYEVGGRACA